MLHSNKVPCFTSASVIIKVICCSVLSFFFFLSSQWHKPKHETTPHFFGPESIKFYGRILQPSTAASDRTQWDNSRRNRLCGGTKGAMILRWFEVAPFHQIVSTSNNLCPEAIQDQQPLQFVTGTFGWGDVVRGNTVFGLPVCLLRWRCDAKSSYGFIFSLIECCHCNVPLIKNISFKNSFIHSILILKYIVYRIPRYMQFNMRRMGLSPLN